MDFLQLYPEITTKREEYTGPIPHDSFHKYCTGKYSQNGEEGIVQKILDDIGVVDGWFCDIGAADGITGSNTYFLLEKGWNGVCVEPALDRYEKLRKNYSRYPKAILRNVAVTPEGPNSLDNVLSTTSIPEDFDVISIDIDNLYYFVWEKSTKYRPKIMVIEFAHFRDPICELLPGDRTPKPSKYEDILYHLPQYASFIGQGASFHSMIKLGLRKGYVPIASTGNIIFVRRDLEHLVSFRHFNSHRSEDYLYLYPEFSFDNVDTKKWVTNSFVRYYSYMKDLYQETGIYGGRDPNKILDKFFPPEVAISAPVYITSYSDDCDGGGSVVQRIVSAYAVAKRLNIPFVLTKQDIHMHNRDNSPDWSSRWNNMFSFSEKQDNLAPETVTFTGTTMEEFKKFLQDNPNRPVNLFSSKYLADQDISILQDVKDDLRKRFSLDSPVKFDRNIINIAFHVRRFTPTDSCLHPVRKLLGTTSGDDYYYSTMKKLQILFSSRHTVVHIFSEGEPENFSKFSSYETSNFKVKLHLDMNAIDVVQHMVHADVFVASVSSFSYIAHLIREGPTIAHPEQFHKWLPETYHAVTGEIAKQVKTEDRIQTISQTLDRVISERPQGFGAMAKDVHQALEWDQIIQKYNPDIWIETGTYLGETTEYMALMYPDLKIITIESEAKQYEAAKVYLDKYPNITVIHAPSEKVIGALGNFRCPFYFFDAHWFTNWPILDELKAVKNGIVCIHDFDINHPKYGYDVYEKTVKLDKKLIGPVLGGRTVYGNNPDSVYPLPCKQSAPRGRAYICYEEDNIFETSQNFKKL